MNAETRTMIRAMLDQHARHRTNADIIIRPCQGCGAHFDDHTPGCGTCSDRHARRNRRKKGQT